MKSGYRYILIVIIALIIIGGLALFFLREKAVNYLSDSTGVSEKIVPAKVGGPSAKDTLDLTTINSQKFKALKNNVVKFDFDSICKTPVGKIETVATSSDGATTTSTQIINCVVGNSVPFPVPVKKKD